ncbi:MAG: radical SAM protein [Micrococcales bacterium]|nr:radical SAM protein [Micrococcales bacterium]
MKIAFLAPAGAMHRHSGKFHKALHYAPMTLAVLAGMVPEEWNARLSIYDETAGPIPLDLDDDIIAMTCITGTAERCYRYADYYRSLGKTVILGGPHPSLVPEEAALHADAVVTGLGDGSFVTALSDWREGALKPLYRQLPGAHVANRPLPRRDLLRRRAYITLNTVEAVRGCNLVCTFCAYPEAFGTSVRTRPVEDVIAEIRTLPGRIVVFPDVNLIADRAYAVELFTAMIPLKKWWFGLTTTAIGRQPELLQLLAQSGCKGLLIGFESVSQASQVAIHKSFNHVSDYKALMSQLHEVGIMVMGCFAFGADGDDATVFDATVRLIEEAKIDLPRFAVLTPFPSTPLYRELDEAQRIVKHGWSLYDVEHVVFLPKNMTPDELTAGLTYAWRKAYTLRSVLRRLDLRRIKHGAVVFLALNLAYRVYARHHAAFDEHVMADNSDIPLPRVML